MATQPVDFQDILAEIIAQSPVYKGFGDEVQSPWEQAGLILDSDELQAIRRTLRGLARRAAANVDVRWLLLWNELSPSVREWVWPNSRNIPLDRVPKEG